MEPVHLVQMNIYQNNTCKKNLSWLYVDTEPRVEERQQVRDQQSYIFVSLVYLVAARSTRPDTTIVFHGRPYDRFVEIKSNLRRNELHRTN